MSKEEKTRLVSTDSADTVAEEVHPGTGEKPSSKRGSKADTSDASATSDSATKRKRSCPMYFGVKSYLHQFYDSHASYKDPSVYEDDDGGGGDDDDDDMYLLHPDSQHRHHHRRRRRRCCPPIWWKIFMWVGVNLLLFGVVGILVGYLVPPKTYVLGENKSAEKVIINESAKSYNLTLDMCKLIGLVLFCVGGITLAMSLLFPSFFTHYCDDDGAGGSRAAADEPIKVPLRAPEDLEEGGGAGGGGGGGKGPLSPVEMTIPATSKVKNVQPATKAPQSVLTQASAVAYKD